MKSSEYAQWSVKHRPTSFDDVVGNKTVVNSVKELLKNRSAHAVMFIGPSGCGKTTLAKLVAEKASGGININIIERNFAAEGGKDVARGVIESIRAMPSGKEGNCRVVIGEEAHGLTKDAASALLRPIEEPPHKNIMWVWATDKPWQLDGTVLMRFRRFQLEVPTEEELLDYLYKVADDEKAFRKMKDADFEKMLKDVAAAASYVPRESLQLMQNMHDARITNIKQAKAFIRESSFGSDAKIDLAAARILNLLYTGNGDGKAVMEEVINHSPITLLNRLLFVGNALLIFATTGKYNFSIKQVLELFNKSKPPLVRIAEVNKRLATLRNDLTNISSDPAYALNAELVLIIKGN